ncbi:MAG: DNA-binding protein [Bryobacterales bacterium]|nr:DNA-binding protein [Bryobacterales bacterium]
MTRNVSVFTSAAALAFATILSGQSPAPAEHPPANDPNYLPRVTPIKPGMAPKMSVKPLPAISRNFRVEFSTGDELMSGMAEFAEKNNLKLSEVSGLGGISSAVVSAYDPEKGAFKRFSIDQKGELVSLQGEITVQNGKPSFHAHVVFVLVDGTVHGGHLVEAHINPVANLFVTEYASPSGEKTSGP